VLLVGLVVTGLGWTSALATWYPFPAGEAAWLWGTRVIGLSLVVVGWTGPGRTRPARVVAILLGLACVLLAVAYASYVSSLPFHLRDLVPQAWLSVRGAIARASFFTAAFVLLYGALAWHLWSRTRTPTRRGPIPIR
jgi:hypothetical protein